MTDAYESPVYKRLVQQMKDKHPDDIDDQEAHRLARNLVGYCELVIKIHARKERERLDEEKD